MCLLCDLTADDTLCVCVLRKILEIFINFLQVETHVLCLHIQNV